MTTQTHLAFVTLRDLDDADGTRHPSGVPVEKWSSVGD